MNNEIREWNLFDHVKYINSNPDLKKVYGSELELLNNNRDDLFKEKIWRHWCIFGLKENREWCYKEIDNNITKEYFENNYVIYITRHMCNDNSSKYWIQNYENIRKFYKNIKIIIIDDNSKDEYLKKSKDEYLKNDKNNNIEFIYTKHLGRGEILPYYYFSNSNEKKYALILHDSIVMEKEIHRFIEEKEYMSLWSFFSRTERQDNIKYFEFLFKNEIENINEYVELFKSDKWRGVFGGMSIISNKLVCALKDKYNIFEISMSKINTRKGRKVFERMLGLILHKEGINTYESLLGNIQHWCKNHYNKWWNISLNEYMSKNKKNECILSKIWTGR